jgi:CO/xanthine dehydrogenase Mo-binding subunit
MDRKHTIIGRSVLPVDGKDKVKGRAKYLDDIELPGMLYAKILRSPHAHARIVRIDIEAAMALPGVVSILTAADCPEIPFGCDLPDATILPRDKVRYVGEEVAAVSAITPKIAKQALDLIDVQYETLPAVFEPADAIQEDAPLIHEDKPGNIAKTYQISRGDFDRELAGCDHVFEEEFSTPRVLPCYMEPFGLIADWEPHGRLTIITGIQAAFQARSEIAKALGLSPSQVSIKVPTIGGAFGGKIWIRNFHPIIALLAQKSERPVKFVMTREEEFAASRPRVSSQIKVKLGMMNDGTLVCKDMQILTDNGAFSWAAPKVTLNMSMRTDCLYRYKATKVEARLVYTNKTPTSGFRGYGNSQSHFAVESMIDICARKLGLDPIEVRLKNAASQGDTTLHGWKLRSCGLSECLQKASDSIKKDRHPREDKGGLVKRGIGLACMNHVSGNRAGTNFDGSSSMVRFQEDGKLVVYHGESDMGQGSRTIFALIAAETLGIAVEDVIVMPLDTDVSPFCFGTYSSRVTTVGGKAVYLASLRVKKQLLDLASQLMDAPPEILDIQNSQVFIKSDPNQKMAVADLCQKAIRSKTTIELTAYVAYDPPTQGTDENFYGDYSSAYTYAAQAVEVEIDTETGQVKILRVASAHDVGYAVNPNGVRGQVFGGIAQGAGWGLYENIVYEDGVLKTTSMRNYNLITINDMPEVKPILVETHDPVGPYGAKGVGEPTLIPMAPAIANAVEDAIGHRFRSLPITAEDVFVALHPECNITL